MQSGWIKLHRQIQDCCLWNSNEPYDRRSAWVDLLLMANHEDKTILVNGRPLIVHRGQKYTSVRYLSSRWKWSKSKTERYIDVLKSLKMLDTDGTPNGTLVTIANYEKFQSQWDTEWDTKRDTHEPRAGHGRVTNKNIKNDKNDKEERKGASPRFDEEGNELF